MSTVFEGSYTELKQAEEQITRLRTENERLRAALQKIVAEADSHDGLTAWDGADIARAALAGKQNTQSAGASGRGPGSRARR